MPMLNGPYPLDNQYVNSLANRCGVYVLVRQQGWQETIIYVGRSTDLRTRLQQHLPGNEKNDCIRQRSPTHFRFTYTREEREAYEEECRLYHRHQPPCNDLHPAKSDNRWKCPVCGQ